MEPLPDNLTKLPRVTMYLLFDRYTRSELEQISITYPDLIQQYWESKALIAQKDLLFPSASVEQIYSWLRHGQIVNLVTDQLVLDKSVLDMFHWNELILIDYEQQVWRGYQVVGQAERATPVYYRDGSTDLLLWTEEGNQLLGKDHPVLIQYRIKKVEQYLALTQEGTVVELTQSYPHHQICNMGRCPIGTIRDLALLDNGQLALLDNQQLYLTQLDENEDGSLMMEQDELIPTAVAVVSIFSIGTALLILDIEGQIKSYPKDSSLDLLGKRIASWGRPEQCSPSGPVLAIAYTAERSCWILWEGTDLSWIEIGTVALVAQSGDRILALKSK